MDEINTVKVDSEQQLENELTSHANVLLLFTKKGCKHCENLKEKLKSIDIPKYVDVVEVPFDKAKTYELFEGLDIDRAPTGLMVKECDFAGAFVGDTDDNIIEIKETYKDARNACKLEDGTYKPIAEVVHNE